MSHEIDMSNNRANMAFVGQTPWHGLGNKLDPDADLDTWRESAGFNWEAIVSPVVADFYGYVEIPTHKALVRSDTKSVLSVVSNGYKPVQPSEVMEFFRNLVEGIDAGFKMETAGCLLGGKKIWALAKSDGGFVVGNKDKVDQYLLMATSFDRSLPTIAQLTSTRVVCQNTLNIATKDKSNSVRITHNRKFDSEKAKQELGILDSWQKFAQDCMKFADKKMSSDDSKKYFAECMAVSNPHRDVESYINEEDDTIEELFKIKETAPGQNMDSAKGTLWGDLNTITRYFDYEVKSKSQQNRLNSSWFGRGNRVKNFAYNLASSMV